MSHVTLTDRAALRLCDPSSYALLGVTSDHSFTVDANERAFPEAAAGPPEVVTFGLLPSDGRAVDLVLNGSGLAVCLAAQAKFGSSEKAFAVVAEFLLRTIDLDLMTMPAASVWEADRAAKRTLGYFR